MEVKYHKTVMELSMEFSLILIDYKKTLNYEKSGNIMDQLMRSGTAIGAMIREAQGAESQKDFVHKLKVAYKEAEESEYWLRLQAHSFPSDEVQLLLNTLLRIKQMLGKILSTSARKKLGK